MEENQKLKLFICYSHLDEASVKEFIKHLSPLKNNGLLEEWYDRKIIAGQDYQDTIDNNLDNADIICLCISANFLSSRECIKEKTKAVEFYKKKGTVVIPIILSACGWVDEKEISTLLVLPTDGKPVSTFQDLNVGFYDVYTGLKKAIEREIKINKLKVSNAFLNFLNSTEILTKAHPQKESVLLDDIFIYPDLIKYEELNEYNKKISSEQLVGEFFECHKILIEGEDQSGKTTLCKKLFIELFKKRFVPIYLIIKTSDYQEKIATKISIAYKEQYEGVSIEEFDKRRIIPIIDDFHYSKVKEKYIEELANYFHQVIIVDDIFRLNFKDESIIKNFNLYKIKEYNPYLRNELIRKWINLSDTKNGIIHTANQNYQSIDQKTELVNAALGKVLGTGIMPAFPFFILSVISTYETFNTPLDQEITSQGYCYQALIYLALRKQGVKNEEIETYINFITEFAFYLFSINKSNLTALEFETFMQQYLNKFIFPIKKGVLLSKLDQGRIICSDSCSNFLFYYPYIYYYFVGKYLAEHIEENKDKIDSMIRNLHKNEYAYIAIFISHHSKSIYVLDEIILNALTLFDKYKKATLTKEELKFFDEEVDNILNEVLPSASHSPEKERKNRLEIAAQIEESHENEDETKNDDFDPDSELAKELRRGMKTVEVLGRIIKNRAGSLEKNKLSLVFEVAMSVHLRILTSFLNLIKEKEGQEEIINFILSRLSKVIEESDKKPYPEKLEKISRLIFWNTNFSVIYSFISHIIYSLGSNQLISIVEEVCDKENTPVTYIIKHGILMWYAKNLQIDNIANKLQESNFAEIAKKMMRAIIVNHSSMHLIDYKEKQKIENKIGIPIKRLLVQNIKKQEDER